MKRLWALMAAYFVSLYVSVEIFCKAADQLQSTVSANTVTIDRNPRSFTVASVDATIVTIQADGTVAWNPDRAVIEKYLASNSSYARGLVVALRRTTKCEEVSK